MKTRLVLAALFLSVLFVSHTLHSQVLVDTWTFDANDAALSGLNPATYAADYPPSGYKPSVLVSDADSSGSATISLGSYASGGLGSAGFPEGYGGFYTFFSPSVAFTLQTSAVLSGVQTITFSFLAGGGNPTPITFNQSSLALNFNSENTAAAASDFSTATGVIALTPIGDQSLTLYAWTWEVGDMGGSTGFSLAWSASSPHSWFQDVTLTQAIPEPSTYALMAAALGAFVFPRIRRVKTSGGED